MKILDENHQVIQTISTEDNIAHGEKFNFIQLIETDKTRAKYFTMKVLDPNTDKTVTQNVEFQYFQGKGLHKIAEHAKVQKISYD
jgi:hypothetical protein